MNPEKSISELHRLFENKYWDYVAEYANHNGYRKDKEITEAICKRLEKIEIAIKQLKEKRNEK